MTIENGEVTPGLPPEVRMAIDLGNLTGGWLKEGYTRSAVMGGLLGYTVLALIERDGHAATAARLATLANTIGKAAADGTDAARSH